MRVKFRMLFRYETHLFEPTARWIYGYIDEVTGYIAQFSSTTLHRHHSCGVYAGYGSIYRYNWTEI
jgi:hypothetical protein